MIRHLMRSAAAGVVLAFVFCGSALAQDFSQSYNVGPGGRVRVGNISGDISVTGYAGDAVIVSAYKEGADAYQVEVEDRSTAGSVNIGVRYPKDCRCEASVRFEIRVPNHLKLTLDRISSVSGRIDLSGVAGDVTVSSVSGSVKVSDVHGVVNASSVSGNVEVDITSIEGDGNMKFSSVSGSVHVRMPSYVGARVNMSTLSGDLKTDFPLDIVKSKYGPGISAKGVVGDGSRTLELKSVSGNVFLNQ